MISKIHRRCTAAAACASALGALAIATSPGLAQDYATEENESIDVSVMTAEGENAGMVTFEQALHGVVVTARLENLTEGPHGFHIHETGSCSPDFGAAGGHYDPLNAVHGFDSPGGYHVGDLPNIHVEADGTATADFFVPQITLSGADNGRYPFTLSDTDGSAVMIHAKIDDYSNEPAGSSGARMACGVIVPDQR